MVRAELWFDGACQGNPGSGGAGAFIRIEGEMAVRIHQKIRHCTNNEAEYLGLIIGLEYAKKLGVKALTVRGDSKLVVEQAAGRWRVKKDHLKPYFGYVSFLLESFREVSMEWIPREANHDADAASRGLRAIPWQTRGRGMRAVA